MTRARQILVATTHAWGEGRKTPGRVSGYLEKIQPESERLLDEPVSQTNPLGAGERTVPWPDALDEEASERRAEAAEAVERARAEMRAGHESEVTRVSRSRPPSSSSGLRRGRVGCGGPGSQGDGTGSCRGTVTSAVMALNSDPAPGTERAPPVPTAGSGVPVGSSSTPGWSDAGASMPLDFEEDDQSGAGSGLEELIEAFQGGFADRVPSVVEIPFSLVLGRQVVRGRIDAVYTDGDRPPVVD